MRVSTQCLQRHLLLRHLLIGIGESLIRPGLERAVQIVVTADMPEVLVRAADRSITDHNCLTAVQRQTVAFRVSPSGEDRWTLIATMINSEP